MASTFRSIVRVIAQLAALLVIAAAFFIRTPQVSGQSMEPGIQSGEYVLINTFAYRFWRVQRGDVLAFHHDSPTEPYLIKRVIGLPGERIAIDRGIVSIDGIPLSEPYVHFHDNRSVPALTVPIGTLYMLGDNRANSDDSRDWGVLAKPAIIGKAVAGIWPLSAFGVL